MRKISLRLDDLQVETFATEARRAERGTVRGNGWTDLDCTEPRECPSVQTGAPECGSQCQHTGNASCYGCPADSFSCATCSYDSGQIVLFPNC